MECRPLEDLLANLSEGVDSTCIGDYNFAAAKRKPTDAAGMAIGREFRR
jgi:hypothetical protein